MEQFCLIQSKIAYLKVVINNIPRSFVTCVKDPGVYVDENLLVSKTLYFINEKMSVQEIDLCLTYSKRYKIYALNEHVNLKIIVK